MNRRDMLRMLGTVGVAGALPPQSEPHATGRTVHRYEIHGTGPALIAFDRAPKGYFDGFSDRYRVIDTVVHSQRILVGWYGELWRT